MRLCSVTVLVLLLSSIATAQQYSLMTDEQFLDVVHAWRNPPETGAFSVAGEGPGRTCGIEISLEAIRRMPLMNAANRSQLKAFLAPPVRDTSIVSPSGRFRIHFDLTGLHEPAMLQDEAIRIPGTAFQYAQKVGEFFDHVYDVEVLQHGYKAPPLERNKMEYNVYLKDYGTNTYGETVMQDQIPGPGRPVFETYIEMDNDFRGFYSKGLNGAKVTVAHEFHHAIELGGYGAWFNDVFFYEMTATYFEEDVYSEVNDYYQYLRSFFNDPQRSLYRWQIPGGGGGYEAMVFVLMLVKRHGPELLRKIWEEIRQSEPLLAVDRVLKTPAFQSDLATEFCRFAMWNYYTGYRSFEEGQETYDEASAYPTVKIAVTQQLLTNTVTFSGSVTPLGTQYFRTFRGADTTVISVSNTDLAAVLRKDNTGADFTLEVRAAGFGPEFTPIGNGWGYRLTPQVKSELCVNVFGKDAVRNPGTKPFPNPFDPVTDGVLRFPVSTSTPEARAVLAIFSPSMNLVTLRENLEVKVDEPYGRFVTWDGKTDAGDTAPSGIYIYSISHGADLLTGKFAVIKH